MVEQTPGTVMVQKLWWNSHTFMVEQSLLNSYFGTVMVKQSLWNSYGETIMMK